MQVTFQTDHAPLQAKWDAALDGLRANLRPVFGSDRPVLIEGAEYPGIWLECGPHEGLLYGQFVDPAVALASHQIFFRHQREDGYLPCWVRRPDADWAYSAPAGTGQIQMVVPIAATAWETYELTGNGAFLEEAYHSCVQWDDWLARFRDTRGTGLCEAFCEFDTGHDNSPRWAGLPHECPDQDARRCPPDPRLPYLAPDLSATVYGGRRALARMADALGRPDEAACWREKADATRQALTAHCWDAQDEAFYDRDAQGNMVRLRGDVLTRVCGEGALDAAQFEALWTRHLHDPAAFWTPYPFPSIAADDSQFVRGLPPNSWGGASQALTALRAPRWMDAYGKPADLAHLLGRWQEALIRADGFRQQMNPWMGDFIPAADGYSPAMLVLLEAVSRRHGVRQAGDTLEWSCPPVEGAARTVFTLETPDGRAELHHDGGRAELRLDGRTLAAVRGACRVVTDRAGAALCLVGIASEETHVHLSGGPTEATVSLAPNARYDV